MKASITILLFLSLFTLPLAAPAEAGTSPKTLIYKADQALALNPKDAKAYYNRGTAHLELDEYDQAISDLTQVIALEPQTADAYFNRGMAYRLQKKDQEAIADYSRAIALFSENWAYFFERCNARIVTADYDGAISDGQQLIRLAPKDAESYFMRGLASYLKGDPKAGLEYAEKALGIKNWHKGSLKLKTEILGLYPELQSGETQ